MMNFHDFAANWFTFSRHPLLFPGEEEWMHSKAYSVSCLEFAVSVPQWYKINDNICQALVPIPVPPNPKSDAKS